MSGNNSKKAGLYPWGDDHPEKLQQSPNGSIGIKQQVKSLINPSNVLEQIFNSNRTGERKYYPSQAEKKVQRQETLIFSRRLYSENQSIQEETKVLLKQLKEQVVLLEKSEKSLSAEISKIKVAQMPNKSGIYYIRFFEWMLTVVKQLRMKVEEGRTWLAAFNSRKKKRIGYWNMYKKHGTTFGLSNERTLSTQTG
ncbi:hypothetical protein A2960_02040 [Candidatus Gottesmanbacteria bacterium RIFCSPLOWO2_01_FULL_39_12b]|uniref:DUF5660 domain-containing protein n=1 Tax=Candidatus Gottesmanbacteria bacterium RIFCSPLOWO2_01_FULL_39_12b TaxID=1798388 RepID=A0A1F6AQD8_9BACT|nr:MAG: hypothetical protein A2960_02040 [Candidatus Gottesmanbacteria bacterium RIFCSPLOWO2_01_FULL_39_12b]